MRIMITGATSGIGEAFARLVRRQGHEVVAIGRSEEKLNQLQTEIGAEAHHADLTKKEDRDRIAELIRSDTPDVLVNAAGIGLLGAASDHELSEELDMANVDGLAVLQFTLEAVHAWKKAGKHGTVLNVASIAAGSALPLQANYAALKSYVSRLSQAMDVELAPHGIRVLVTWPGPVMTEWLARAGGGPTPKFSAPPVTAEYAADRWWKQIEAGKRLDIFDWHIKGLDLVFKLMPRKMRLAVGRKVMSDLMK